MPVHDPNDKKDTRRAIQKVPTEIWLSILHQIIGVNIATDNYSSLFTTVPAALCLVNRQWNQIFTKSLYHQFRTTCHPKHNRTLWNFLRTLVLRPDLARHVRQLTMISTGLFASYAPLTIGELIATNRNLYNENLVRTASRQAGWEVPGFWRPWYSRADNYHSGNGRTDWNLGLEANRMLSQAWDFVRRLEDGSQDPDALERMYHGHYHAPLLALIIAHCTNVKHLYMHTPTTYAFFEDVMSWATHTAKKKERGRPGFLPLQKLESLHLAPALQRYPNDNARIGTPVPTTIDKDRAYHLLPMLKELVVMGAQISFEPGLSEKSTVEKLTLAYTIPADFSLDRILPTFTNLRQLTLKIKSEQHLHGPALHADLWTLFHPLADTLEYLDLHQSHFQFLNPANPFPDNDELEFCPLLHRFTKLKYLSTTPLILYGHQCSHDAPWKLQSHLPPNLISLGLYTENMDWLPDHIEDFENELAGLVVGGAARGLRAIVIDSAHDGQLPMTALRDAADTLGLFFRANGGRYLFFGGVETPFDDVSRPGVPAARALYKLEEKRVAECLPEGMEVHSFKGRLGAEPRRRPAELLLGVGDNVDKFRSWDEFQEGAREMRDFPTVYPAPKRQRQR
ncbi:hypothetical protein BDW59DRAFT_163092 [Aspergillus cavernicola]|uniref:F-box domain-containing protein n=1 Tax=Aspergillus cavernicola TaxID=176166 RepID=A0ABR4I7Q1_9EURO